MAYWKFNEPDADASQFRGHIVAKDSSGHGNDLLLVHTPVAREVVLTSGPAATATPGQQLKTSSLEFRCTGVALLAPHRSSTHMAAPTWQRQQQYPAMPAACTPCLPCLVPPSLHTLPVPPLSLYPLHAPCTAGYRYTLYCVHLVLLVPLLRYYSGQGGAVGV